MRRYGMRGFGAVTAASVKTAQGQINSALATQGFLPIKTDGIGGPATCGAARVVAHPILTELNCKKFTEPTRSPTGPAIPPPGPNSPVVPGVPPGPLAPAPAAGMFGFDTKTIVIGAAVVGLGVVAVYFLKKKSQAGAAA